MRKPRILLAALALIVPLLFYGCSGSDGNQGPAGATGATGGSGTTGTPGASGTVGVSTKHGESALAAEEMASAGKYMVTINITGASADAAGAATVNFTVMNGSTPVSTITSVSGGIFKLMPPANGYSYNKWVPYLWRAETVSGTQDTAGNPFVNPSGTVVYQGYRESSGTGASNGTLVNNGGGSYTYTFKKNLAAATLPDNVTLIGYDRTLTHRVSIYTGGHNGPTGEGDFDFVPNGSAVVQTRNIVQTAACRKCHGAEFAGHGGDRVTLEGCVGCHSPDSKDAQSGESIEMAVMTHKIHAGNELASVAGADGHYYDNPYTLDNEVADNGRYILWGNSVRAASWEGAAFPAGLANCQVCHTGSGANVDNWKNVPSRAACGSCHDRINWVTGANHPDGSQPSDADCAICHPATGVVPDKSVTEAHNWTDKDIRNKPEFNIALTVSAPANGSYFVNGESPVISIALTDAATGAVVTPSTVVEDGTGEGCVPAAGAESTTCTVPRDGLFRAASVYVTGPRAQRIPVLSYSARAKATSANAGPWDLSAGGTIRVKVDSGMNMISYNTAWAYEGYGADELISGDITVSLPASAFAAPAAVTPAQLAAVLNADATFHERAIAYVEESGYLVTPAANAGKLSIRTRGIVEKDIFGNVVKATAQPNIQVVSNTPAIFTDTAVKFASGASQARIRSTASGTDPKADFSDSAAIKYYLDNVDNLVPGTYVINVEFGDSGRAPTGTAPYPYPQNPPEPPYVNYRTPSVAVATFKVKQAAAEKPIADGCQNCHWSSASNTGFVLDYPRHNKPFKADAVDQCGGCHDYNSGQNPTGTSSSFSSGHPISKRVHAVHNGSNLTYPTITVAHEETAAFGRNWRITYPMNIRTCDSCHPASTTSGSWQTNPNRVACMGCHDSDAATAHMKISTYDPTPLAPWSGDEQESCKACH